jgi:glycoprotein-N-acetylgalactosamine 3-beta-galactosyltransferase
MTGADNHETKAVHIKATWAKRCNKFMFLSTKENAELPAISLNISDGRDHLWGKTKAAFKYAYEKHLVSLKNVDYLEKIYKYIFLYK